MLSWQANKIAHAGLSRMRSFAVFSSACDGFGWALRVSQMNACNTGITELFAGAAGIAASASGRLLLNQPFEILVVIGYLR